ncbi:MAG: cytidylyltransferase domain-containing protein [Solirubrobacterales bacterium]
MTGKASALRSLAIVPARGGSQRIPNKNLAEVGGRSLVRRALEAALRATHPDRVVLSSDHDPILDEGRDVPGVQVIPRPRRLATPRATSYSVVMHVLEEVERSLDFTYEAVALIQCTSPFTSAGDIDGALRLMERTGAGSVFTVTQVDHGLHPEKFRRFDGDRLIPLGDDVVPRAAHELSDLWVNNGSVYVSSRATLEAGSLASNDLCGYPMPPERSLDINAPLDLAFARFIADSPET